MPFELASLLMILAMMAVWPYGASGGGMGVVNYPVTVNLMQIVFETSENRPILGVGHLVRVYVHWTF